MHALIGGTGESGSSGVTASADGSSKRQRTTGAPSARQQPGSINTNVARMRIADLLRALKAFKAGAVRQTDDMAAAVNSAADKVAQDSTAAKKSISELQGALQSSAAEAGKQRERIGELEGALQSSEAQKRAADRQIRKLTERLLASQANVAQLQSYSKLAARHAELAQLRSDNERLQADNASLQHAVQANEQAQHAAPQLANVQTHIAAARQQACFLKNVSCLHYPDFRRASTSTLVCFLARRRKIWCATSCPAAPEDAHL